MSSIKHKNCQLRIKSGHIKQAYLDLSKQFSARNYLFLVSTSEVKFSLLNLLIFLVEPVNRNNYQKHYLLLSQGALIIVFVYRQ